MRSAEQSSYLWQGHEESNLWTYYPLSHFWVVLPISSWAFRFALWVFMIAISAASSDQIATSFSTSLWHSSLQPMTEHLTLHLFHIFHYQLIIPTPQNRCCSFKLLTSMLSASLCGSPLKFIDHLLYWGEIFSRLPSYVAPFPEYLVTFSYSIFHEGFA